MHRQRYHLRIQRLYQQHTIDWVESLSELFHVGSTAYYGTKNFQLDRELRGTHAKRYSHSRMIGEPPATRVSRVLPHLPFRALKLRLLTQGAWWTSLVPSPVLWRNDRPARIARKCCSMLRTSNWWFACVPQAWRSRSYSPDTQRRVFPKCECVEPWDRWKGELAISNSHVRVWQRVV